jgi:hypothetical protein
MASGNTLIAANAMGLELPATNPAGRDERNGHRILDFDAAADEVAILAGVLPRHYTAGGITIALYWMAATATSGNVVWDAAVERHAAGTDDLDADSFAAAVAASAAATSGTSGVVTVTSIALTNSQIDGLLAGESFRLRIRRLGTNAGDTMTGDAELLRVEVRET